MKWNISQSQESFYKKESTAGN